MVEYNPYQQQIDQLQAEIDQNKLLLSDPELAELAQAEIDRLNNQKDILQQSADQFDKAQQHDTQSDDAGIKPNICTIEIRGGAGGDEAKIWASDLQRMYLRLAENNKLEMEIIDDLVFKLRGSLLIAGERIPIYYALQAESGVHRVQRVPETESSGRIHTSTATVAVLPQVARTAVEIREEDLDWQFMRAGGAGGQNVNKVNSAVRLTHLPSGVVVTARQEKKQEQNRKIALDLLAAQLWEAQEAERLRKLGEARSAIGSAARAEKIRTYNFPQNRVTDHRLNESWYDLPNILDGKLDEIITACYQHFNTPDSETNQDE